MTQLAQEKSQREGAPIELFLFRPATSATGTGYTNNDVEETFGADTFTPIAISRTEPAYNDEGGAGNVDIMVPRDNSFVRRFIQVAPGENYIVSIYRKHDMASPSVPFLFWKGYISQVVFEGMAARIVCKPLIELITRIGPRMRYQQPCNHFLYDDFCTVTEGTFQTNRVPDSVSADGTILTFSDINALPPVTSAPSGYQGNFWVGGFIRTPDQVDHRLIVAQTGAHTIQVQFPFHESPAGKTMQILAGCDHQPLTCQQKFANLENHGGHPEMPTRNPFTKGLSG